MAEEGDHRGRQHDADGCQQHDREQVAPEMAPAQPVRGLEQEPRQQDEQDQRVGEAGRAGCYAGDRGLRARAAEDAAEQEDGGGQRRRPHCDRETKPRHGWVG